MIATLRQRNFALLWTAGLVSLVGDWAFYTAMPIFVLDRTGSAFQAGLVWAMIALPGIFIGPLAGVYVDRWDRRRIMLWGNVLQAGVASLLLLAGGEGGVWIAMAVLLAQASLYSVYSPAGSALLPTLVEDQHLVSANALNSLNDNVARIAGPIVGALLYAWFGIQGIAFSSMASFAGSAVLVSMVATAARPAFADHRDTAGAERESLWRSMRIGAGVVWHNRMLRALFLIIGFVGLADGPLTAMLAPFVRQSLDRGAEDFGTLLSVRGVAGILGGVVIAQIGRRFRDDRLLITCLFVLGTGVVAIAAVHDFILTLAIMVLGGPAIIGLNTVAITLLQRNSEDEFRGRMFSLLGAFSGTVFLTSTVLGSAATSHFSPTTVLAASGVLYLVAGFAAFALLPSPAPDTGIDQPGNVSENSGEMTPAQADR